MPVLIYRPRPSPSAVALAEELRGRGVPARKVKTLRRLTPDDLLVCWGVEGPADHPHMLNGGKVLNKYEELSALAAADVPTVPFSREYQEGWLGRSFYHSKASDLLYGGRVDFYTERQEFEYEARVHVWEGLSIRAGIKQPIEGRDVHQWIRARDTGWAVAYTGVSPRVRDVAKRAVEALRLDYGAVDLGVEADGTVMVLEVNRAPGLEGNTLKVYADRISKRWEEMING